ncbi:MAG: hypothetical protein KAT30_17980, partial [Candidatus Krumholzibacteria bacterium]|nr:hypothetical protein [Candidatus Krumholzibacteria bacterium]
HLVYQTSGDNKKAPGYYRGPFCLFVATAGKSADEPTTTSYRQKTSETARRRMSHRRTEQTVHRHDIRLPAA